MSKRPLFMLVFTGYDSTYVHLVEEEVWKQIRACSFIEEGRRVGNPANDAALHAPRAIVNGREADFYSMEEARDFIKRYQIEIVDTYEGRLY